MEDQDENQSHQFSADDFERFVQNRAEENPNSNANINQFMNTITTLLQQNTQMLQMLQKQQQQPLHAPNQESPVRNYNVMPDLSKTIEIFSAEEEPSKAKLWLQQLETAATLHNWPDAFIFQTAKSNLIGAARHWYSGRSSEVVDWSSFRMAFIKTFVFTKNKTELWKRMQERVQSVNENVSVYFHSKASLCKELSLSFEEEKEQIAIGLWSRELSNFVMSKFHIDEDALYQDIIAYERIVTARKNRLPERKNEIKKPQKTIEASLKKFTSLDQVNNKTIKCYNCNLLGHLASQCKKMPRVRGSCFNCGLMEHKIRDCPKIKGERASTSKKEVEEKEALMVENKFPDRFTLPLCLVKDSKQLFIEGTLDSGSVISIITNSIIRPFNFEISEAPSVDFEGVNKSKLDVIGSIMFKVYVEGIDVQVLFYIVPDDAIPVKCLLGRNFMTNKNISLIFESGKVKIKSVLNDNLLENQENNEILQIDYIDQNEVDLNINSEIDAKNRQKLVDLFVQDYIQPERPEKIESKIKMKIVVNSNHTPFYFKPRRLSFYEKNIVQDLINDMLENNVIQKSTSEYSSPIVLVKKKTNDYRLCPDFRALNKITVRDNFPIPLIEDQIIQLQGQKYFTTLDLKSAFYHVDIEHDSIKYTSFVTPVAQYEFLKMPFGLKNSPSVFMRYIHEIFKELIDLNKIFIYFDDILIPTTTIPENISILKHVFKLLVENRLTLRIDKCTFLYTEIKYLGYIINEKEIRPNDEHLLAIKNYPVPKNVKQVQSFIGLTSYFRKFVPNFSTIAGPLYNLTKKNSKFNFGSEQFTSFNNLKEILMSKPVLALYSPKAETQLHCDASSHGYSGILMQKQKDLKFHPVFYYSQRTTESESKQHSFILELAAIINSIKRFHVYILGIKFKIYTDCNSITLALKKKDINPKIMRWSLFLQNYDYTLEHRSGSNMQHVDSLSRCYQNVLVLEETPFETNLSIRQYQDSKINKIREELEKTESKDFEINNNLVYKKENRRLLFYVPNTMELNVIRSCHDDLGHVGIDKCINAIKELYWFPNMRTKVDEYIKNCLKCITYSPVSGKKEGFFT